MSLARAFTTRRNKIAQVSVAELFPSRAHSVKDVIPTSIRHKISAPVELISTTNMLSYNAPDLFPSNSSGDESDSVPSLTHSPGSSTHDASSLASKPGSPEPNHLSAYFGDSRHSSSSIENAPSIPKRALSHTKRTHEALHRQRSISRMSGQHTSRPSTSSISRDPTQRSPSQAGVDSEPFEQELAQVSELAEEFGVQAVHIVDEEERDLVSRGFYKFAASDYMLEIESLYVHAFGKRKHAAKWI